MANPTTTPAPVSEMNVLWFTAGLSCDGDTVAMTGASNPSIEDIVLGAVPGLPKVNFHHPVLSYEVGAPFLEYFRRAERGELDPFLLIVEGSIPNEKNKTEGYWAAFGDDPQTGQPRTACDWIDRLAPRAWGTVAVGTCSAYGGIHAMAGNPTGCMGLPEYLGAHYRSKGGLPLVCVPGCPIQPDNFMEVFVYLLRQSAGKAPMIPLDLALRPVWLFSDTLHTNCTRGGYYEQADFTERYGEKECIVKLGCWGPVVQCNVGMRGWMGGIGGCPSVGGVCIGCTMPGFPDKFMPFMDQPPGSQLSTMSIDTYGKTVQALRRFTQNSMNKVPERNPSTPETPGGGA